MINVEVALMAMLASASIASYALVLTFAFVDDGLADRPRVAILRRLSVVAAFGSSVGWIFWLRSAVGSG